MDLRDAKVFITGGSSGIGLETARMLRQAGAAVAICGRRRDELERAAKEAGTVAIPCDVSNEDQVKAAIAEAIDRLGGLNVLVNNAGWGKFTKLVDLDLKEFRAVLDTNVVGAMLIAREAARHFVQQNYGNIINVSSTAVAKGAAGGSSYVASKGALKGLNDCWRAELRKHNVRVMLVNPSEVLTNFAGPLATIRSRAIASCAVRRSPRPSRASWRWTTGASPPSSPYLPPIRIRKPLSGSPAIRGRGSGPYTIATDSGQ